MTAPDRWERIEQVYHDALARDEHERATFLRSACGADNQLRSEVESLLARNEAAEALFAVPALQTFGDLLTADVDPATRAPRSAATESSACSVVAAWARCFSHTTRVSIGE
jgi:hypothetical protein